MIKRTLDYYNGINLHSPQATKIDRWVINQWDKICWYLDTCAGNGLTDNDTYALEQLGWKGVVIGNGEVFENRRKAICSCVPLAKIQCKDWLTFDELFKVMPKKIGFLNIQDEELLNDLISFGLQPQFVAVDFDFDKNKLDRLCRTLHNYELMELRGWRACFRG